jgi:integrase
MMATSKRNGRWGARVYDQATHSYIWLGTFDRKKDAEAKERAIRVELALGTYQPPKQMRFGEFVDKWLTTLTVRPSTLSDYENTSNHLKAHFGSRRLSSVTTEDIEAFVATFNATHAPNTTRKALTRLRQILGRAVAWGYLQRDPSREVSNAPKGRKVRQIHILSPEQVAGLLAAAPVYWRPLFLTAVSTGLRRGELFGLTWSDVLWTERKIVVRSQLQDGRLVTPKSETARRRIDIGPALIKALATHRTACPQSDLDLVFPTPRGLPVHTSDFNRDVFKPMTETALLPAARADVVYEDLKAA